MTTTDIMHQHMFGGATYWLLAATR